MSISRVLGGQLSRLGLATERIEIHQMEAVMGLSLARLGLATERIEIRHKISRQKKSSVSVLRPSGLK